MLNKSIHIIVKRALSEDIGNQDISVNLLFNKYVKSQAIIRISELAVVCGLGVVKAVFRSLDPKCQIRFHTKDGVRAQKGAVIAHLKGTTRSLLTGERVALNFLGLLSGTATLTYDFIKTAGHEKVMIMDTRKTVPGLRELQRYAVRCAGGRNHRLNLHAMVMVKDNHLAASQSTMTIAQMIHRLKKKTSKTIEIEVESLTQFRQALDAGPDIILLDNMTPRNIRRAVQINKSSRRPCRLEASGGITLRNIRAVARTGVDRISIGALTHSAKATNYSMEFFPANKKLRI